MQPDQQNAAYLWDIMAAARLTQTFIENMDRDALREDVRTYYAVIAQLQIMGEASKRLTAKFRASHPELPWRDLARMRDWLIHHYDRINLGLVWDTLTKDIPKLIAHLEPLLPPEPPQEN